MRSIQFLAAVLLLAWLAVAVKVDAAPITSGLRLWLDGNDSSTISGSPVSTWTDKSTLGNDATAAGSQRPTFSAGTGPNGTGELTFDGSDDRLNAGTVIPQDTSSSIFLVLDRPDTDGRGGVFQRLTSSPFTGTSLGQGGAGIFGVAVFDSAPDVLSFNGTAKTGVQLWQSSVDFNANPGTTTVRLFEDGGLVGSNTATNIDNLGTGSEPLLIMNRDNSTAMAGDVGEVIVYDRVLNAAERTITQNYLSSKFDFALTAGDFYSGDTLGNSHFDHDVFGVGNDQTGSDPGSLATATSTSQAITLSATGLDDQDFLLAGFETDNDFSQSTMFIDVTNLDGDEALTITFDLALLGADGRSALGFNASDPDSLQIIQAGLLAGDEISFVLTGAQLQDGFFGLVSTVPEPSSISLFSLGAITLLVVGRRRRTRCARSNSNRSRSEATERTRPMDSTHARYTALTRINRVHNDTDGSCPFNSRILLAICVALMTTLLVAPFALAVPVKPAVPVSGYLLDEGTGTATADTFGSNDGTLVAMEESDWISNTPFSYTGNRALNFDGTSEGTSGQRDRVNLGQPANLNFVPTVDEFTISAWFQLDGTGSIVSKAVSTSTDRQYQIFANGGPLTMQGRLGGNAGAGSTTIATGSGPADWHHIVLVAGTSSAQAYLDGVVSGAEFSITPASDINLVDIYLGARHGSNTVNDATTGFELNGRIDEVAFWNSTLSTGNVEWLFANSLSDLIPPPIPEPSSLALIGLGFLGIAGRARRKRGSQMG